MRAEDLRPLAIFEGVSDDRWPSWSRSATR